MVTRDGVQQEIDARELVPGDVIELEAGQAVPADARLLMATEVTADESALTGESAPVEKHDDAQLDADTGLAERATIVYKSTIVTTGHAQAVVVATGVQTEVGRIGDLVRGVEETRTPLERRLDQLGHRLIWVTLAAVVAVLGVGVLRGESLSEMVELAISLAVAAVPEGLVAVATITMAVGVHRMARRRARIRRLPVVETLGAVTVICTDKTGTLTMGRMTATTIWTGESAFELSRSDGAGTLDPRSPLALALRIGTLANRAEIAAAGRSDASGDPTEVALLEAARHAGIDRDALVAEWPEVGEIPFSSERALMATFHRPREGRIVAHVKGAPRRLFELSDRLLTADGTTPLDDAGRKRLLAVNDDLARRGLRVLALATGEVESPTEDSLRGLIFVGFVGIADPPAPGAKETIQRFHRAGIRTVMLTGDQRLTAGAVARELGLLDGEDEVVDGRELERLTDEELATSIARVRAISRVSPADKLRVVRAYRARGAIAAMLGDGVNDAPALKAADVGVAMGGRGTDVAREAASVVLLDDRFETIGAAIEEGRVIFANIQKFVFYLFSCNLAEILVLLVAGIAGLPLPLLPLQILWLNLVTDTFPALALALEPADARIMDQPPNDPRAALLSRRMLTSIGFYGALITAATLGAFVWALSDGDEGRAVTISFVTLSLAQIFHLGTARSAGPVVSTSAIVRNPYALGAVALTLGLQVLAVHYAPLASLLGTRALGRDEWLAAVAFGIMPAVVGQAIRVTGRRFDRDRISG